MTVLERLVNNYLNQFLDSNDFLSKVEAKDWEGVRQTIFDNVAREQEAKYVLSSLIILLWQNGFDTSGFFKEVPQNFFYLSPLGLKDDKLVIPQYITGIHAYGFENSKFDEIKFSGKISFIGERAFQYSYFLKEMTLPEGLKIIEDSAFLWCSGLKKINLPKSLTTVGKDVFRACESLERINYAGTLIQWQSLVDQGILTSFFTPKREKVTVKCVDGVKEYHI